MDDKRVFISTGLNTVAGAQPPEKYIDVAYVLLDFSHCGGGRMR